MKVPEFLADLGRPRTALAALGCRQPRSLCRWVWIRASSAPARPTLKPRCASGPQIESLFLLAALAEAAFLLIGGVLGDTIGRRRILICGLPGWRSPRRARSCFRMARCSSSFASPPWPAVGLVLPVALAVVAVAYSGAARATALGLAYAALGASTALGSGTPGRRDAHYRSLAILSARRVTRPGRTRGRLREICARQRSAPGCLRAMSFPMRCGRSGCSP